MTPDRPMLETVRSALTGNAVLGALSAPLLDRLIAAGSPVWVEAGALLFQAGDEGDAAFVVLSGELEVRTTSTQGRDVRFTALLPGALVGEMAALDGGVRSADVAAVRRSRLWRMPRQVLIDGLSGEPAAALAVIGELSRRLRAANLVLEQTKQLDVAGRLAVLMLTECNRQAVVAMTQTEIARRLGCSREQVNRKLQAWSREGWVRLSPGGVRVLAHPQLQSMIRSR